MRAGVGDVALALGVADQPERLRPAGCGHAGRVPEGVCAYTARAGTMSLVRAQPVTREVLIEHLADVLAARAAGAGWLRVAVDGAPPTRPAALADALVGPLRVRGRPVLRVSAAGFWRPASVRFERGREDPDARYEDWLDEGALVREVLDPFGPGGPGRYLPSLWDADRDRATRAAYADAPPGAVLIVDGSLLLGRWLPFDFAVHLAVSPAALERQLPSEQRWALPAYQRYAAEVVPEQVADVVVRLDHADRPALVKRP